MKILLYTKFFTIIAITITLGLAIDINSYIFKKALVLNYASPC